MFPTPYVRVDLNKVEANIKAMQERLASYHIEHWPHIKTHKSIEIARMQMSAGAKGITCATLSEVEVFANAGIEHIFLAYPVVGEKNIARLMQLREKVNVRITVDNLYVAEAISKVAANENKRIDVLIEIDGGSHRGGVQPGVSVLYLAKKILEMPGLHLVGLFTYVGQIYDMKTTDAVVEETKREAKLLVDNKALLEENGISVGITSGGSTLSSFHAKYLEGISESRAGNYVFGDLNAVAHHVYQPTECALTVWTTVVSTPLPGRATIDAGSKTLTSDATVLNGSYGYVLGHPNMKISKLNEEHGYLEFNPETVQLEVGQRLEIVPNHVCVIPNLNENIYAFRGDEFLHPLEIDARGKNY